MLLLATDTSGKNGSIALARATPGHPEVDIVEVVPLAGGTFSAQLVPQISALLEKHGYSKKDLAALAVVSGPGSFTGLRVGLAAIKALAEVLRKPICAISLLEAVAWSGATRGRVLAALDAGRGEVYVGDYEVDSQVHRYSERLLSREEFVAAIKAKTVVTPDAALADIARGAGIQVEQIGYPDSRVIASLGWSRLESGETVSPESLDANYIRRSDAEIFSKPNPFMSPIVRVATLDDLPAILAIERQAPSAAHWPAEEYEKLARSGVVLVTAEAGQLRGFICAKAVLGEWEIENVVVAPDFHRRGVADGLMHSLINQAEERAASRIVLEVRESNLPARKLYEKHGFLQVGRRSRYYSSPLEDAILYARRCAPGR
jgi:tRNA threonylcarbamoyladenosine biosynthesis protein TsaB